MNKRIRTIHGLRVVLLVTLCSMIASCDDPQIYGSVGYSSWGGGGIGTSVSIGGRIR
jgi:hypothetical protein